MLTWSVISAEYYAYAVFISATEWYEYTMFPRKIKNIKFDAFRNFFQGIFLTYNNYSIYIIY